MKIGTFMIGGGLLLCGGLIVYGVEVFAWSKAPGKGAAATAALMCANARAEGQTPGHLFRMDADENTRLSGVDTWSLHVRCTG